WGASGFTGRLVAEYLHQQYASDTSLRWAMAGRNREKLEAVRAQVADDNIPIVIADSNDQQSLDAMAAQTAVVCTTVGPYAKYGSKLVAACVANKTDYCDLAGEVQWIRKMIDRHHQKAKGNGTRIVHCCGFDSIPSDMGVFFFQQALKEKHGAFAKRIKFRLKAASGGFSGGTIASLNNVLTEAEADKSIYKVLGNPYSLAPEGERDGVPQLNLQGLQFDEAAQSWISPFVMAAINSKVVLRSHALSGYPYGKDFCYDEATLTGDGLGGRVKSTLMAGGMGLMVKAKPGTLLGNVMKRFMPKPGEGPSKEKREAGFFYVLFYGVLPDGTLHEAKVKGDRDPGYGSTSKMLGEAAVCLAKDKAMTP
ncbi:MAG: saccharopine dehydrogenase NADP-binding domain-containing protein, partial [Bacteroidota bacterium]